MPQRTIPTPTWDQLTGALRMPKIFAGDTELLPNTSGAISGNTFYNNLYGDPARQHSGNVLRFESPVNLRITTDYPVEYDPLKIFGDANSSGGLNAPDKAIIFYNFRNKRPVGESIDNIYTGEIRLTEDQTNATHTVVTAQVKYQGKWSPVMVCTFHVDNVDSATNTAPSWSQSPY